MVAADDRARCLRLADPAHARERLAAHVAVRLLLARHGADDGTCRPYQRLPSGKPIHAPCWCPTTITLLPTGIDFSLSHIDGAALVGISRGQPLGVDVERLRAVAIEGKRRAAIEMAAEMLPNAGPLPPDGDVRRLQQAWTRLEALAKARGIGMARLLAEIGVVGAAWTAREAGACAHDGPGAALAADVSVGDLVCPGRDLVAAIARGGGLPQPCTVLSFPATAHLQTL